MANADFLKKLGLKPHVPTTPGLPSTHVGQRTVAVEHKDSGPVRGATGDSAGGQPPKAPAQAPAGASVKPAGLAFKIGGKPVATALAPVAAKPSDSTSNAPTESKSAGTVSDAGVPATVQPVELPTDSPNSAPPAKIDIEPTTDSFKALLDQFDAMVGSIGKITQLELDQSRGFVARIMKDLVTHPELDGLIIDRDVHNVMKFVQASSGMANKNFVTSQERKSKSADKKAAAAAINLDVFDFGADVAGQMAALKAKKGIPVTKPLQLSDLSAINTDDIESKDRR